MKHSLVLALFAVCAPLAAHAQTDDAPDAATPDMAALPLAPASAATSDALVWRVAPPVGSRWKVRSFARATSNTQIPATEGQKAEQFKFVSIQKITADYDVISRDALGATTFRFTLREMTDDTTSTLGGETTKSPATKNAKAVNGATLTIKQAPDGTIWGVVGMRAFQRRILEAEGSLDAATVTQILNSNSMMGGNNLMKSLGATSGNLPSAPVRVGESWNYKLSVPAQLMFALDITGTRTLKSLAPDVAVIADSAVMDGGNAQQKLPAMDGAEPVDVDFSQLKGTLSGTARVQRSSGLPLEETMNLTLRGKVSTKVPASAGVKAQTVIVPLDVTTATRTVLEPR